VETEGDTPDLLTWALRLRELGQAMPLMAPPPLVSQRLRLIPERMRHGDRVVPRIAAQIARDSRSERSVVGMRAIPAESLTRFQLAYRADGFDVVIDVAREGEETVTLRGQVLPDCETLPVFEATAHGPFGTISSILGDELGGFTLRSVPRTTAQLELTNDVVVIVVPTEVWLGR
jgi:hypothetical protein